MTRVQGWLLVGLMTILVLFIVGPTVVNTVADALPHEACRFGGQQFEGAAGPVLPTFVREADGTVHPFRPLTDAPRELRFC